MWAETMAKTFSQHLDELIAVLHDSIDNGTKVNAAVNTIATSLRNGGKLLLCGNGGSAAEAQHIAAEYVSSLRHEFKRKSLPAIALTTDTSFITATGNDFGFETIFERQVESLGQAGDVLIGISTSGNSANVVRAVKKAKEKAMKTIGLTGRSGGEMVALCDITLKVPSDETMRIQECHLLVEHAIADLVEAQMFGN
jgi:D-sedoheptulose 7-phosphate isomerase